MADSIEHNITQASIWKRGLYMLLCAIFYSVAEVVLFAVVIFQFVLKLITGETNQRLLKLGQSLAVYIYQIVQFLNFNSEHLPYPFSGWPRAEPRELKQNKVDKRKEQAVSQASDVVVSDSDSADDAGGQPAGKPTDETGKQSGA